MIGYSENSKIQYIKDIFNEAYSSPQSVIVIDNLDTIVEYYNCGGTMRMMFSLYNSLKTLLSKKPTKANHKLIIIINADEIDIPIKN
jgi:vesicle-fusing ATPase